MPSGEAPDDASRGDRHASAGDAPDPHGPPAAEPAARKRGSRQAADAALFSPARQGDLRRAVAHLSFLLGEGYAGDGSLKLVGDRFQLVARQREAVRRCAMGDDALARRLERRVSPGAVRGADLAIDGFNVLTTLETALSGGLVLLGRDGCLRDVAGVHGTWRRGAHTAAAIDLLIVMLDRLAPARARVLLDGPVSNSGRLKGLLQDAAAARALSAAFAAEVVEDPDPLLIAHPGLTVSADGPVIERCSAWVELAHAIVAAKVPQALLVDLRGG